jgi:acyl-CoA synthetase (AMP-forming)/AMP-acid ligase II
VQPGPDRVPLSIADGVRTFALASPGREAVVEGARRLSFAALGERSDRVATALLAAGLQPGERVALAIGNRLEFAELAAGLAKAGLVQVPINPRVTGREAAAVLDLAEVRAAVLDRDAVPTIGPEVAARDLAAVWELTEPDDGGGTEVGADYEGVLARARAVDPCIEVADTDPFAVFATSGTTGRPKGVQVTHRGRVLTMLFTALEWGIGPGQRTLGVAPVTHGAGFTFAFAAPTHGATAVLQRRFDPEQALGLVAAERVTSAFLVPTHLQLVRSLGDAALEAVDLSSLRDVYVNAAPTPFALKRWVLDRLPGVALSEIYGSTEASVVTCLRHADQLRKPGSVGTPWFHTEVRLLGEDGQVVGPGEIGELYSRSPLLMSGYLGDPEATAACTTPDGFVTAGDVARRDEEGYLSIVDRVTDLIVTGGFNVYPREVEDVLTTHPGVAGAAVAGVPDERSGESIAALVVAREGGVDVDDLRRHCRSHLAGFKVPRIVRVVDALPAGPTGKILKREIRERLAGVPADEPTV